jgi:hypothetical protein
MRGTSPTRNLPSEGLEESVTIEMRRLFLFAGAGASVGMPSALPTFNSLRNELLSQVGLADYVPDPAGPQTGKQFIAVGLAPEPFMLALRHAGTGIQEWLEQTLGGGSPNAVHLVLAQLVKSGAHVWTVNFDRLIEKATEPPLVALSWPGSPGGIGVLKPHGSLGGELIFTSDDVLMPLSALWRERLRSDMHDSDLVVFIGYSARDLDLQPLWTEFTVGKSVRWFDFPDKAEQTRKLAILRKAGQVSFPESLPNDSGQLNPDADFVTWCLDNGLADVPDRLREQLLAERTSRGFPELQGDLDLAKASILSVLGDARAAKAVYRPRVLSGPDRRDAASQILALTINHGGPGVVAALGGARAIPPVGPLAVVRARLLRKRVTLLSNAGQHQRVLRITARKRTGDVSTIGSLRSAAIRMTGSLDDAISLADDALILALRELHNVRIAHAAMQLCYALMWAGRLPEARLRLESELRLFASLAAARWVAWADVIEASLLVHDGDGSDALALLQLAEERFRAEGLLDGVVSTLTVRLTALRQVGESARFRQCVGQLDQLMRQPPRAGTYHARGHVFSREALQVELGEFAQHAENDMSHARALLTGVAASHYPVHAAIGQVTLAHHATDAMERRRHAGRAVDLARRIGAAKVESTARAILNGTDTTDAGIYFP